MANGERGASRQAQAVLEEAEQKQIGMTIPRKKMRKKMTDKEADEERPRRMKKRKNCVRVSWDPTSGVLKGRAATGLITRKTIIVF